MKPVDLLKKGLKKLQDQTHARKGALEAALKANQPISEADEEWLDHTGNLVDEERIVNMLEHASDYACALAQLNAQDKLIVQRLLDLATGDIVPPRKRKRMGFGTLDNKILTWNACYCRSCQIGLCTH